MACLPGGRREGERCFSLLPIFRAAGSADVCHGDAGGKSAWECRGWLREKGLLRFYTELMNRQSGIRGCG